VLANPILSSITLGPRFLNSATTFSRVPYTMKQIVEHPVIETSDWPLVVKDLAQLLSQPFPPWLATGPYPFVSSRASTLLYLLSATDPSQFAPLENVSPVDSPSIRDVFDLVLSTSSDLRDLVGQPDRGGPRRTSPLWSSLIQALCHVSAKEALTL
jgi:hypothetical protein